MAESQNFYTGDGSSVLFSFTFPYLDTDDIKVSLGGVLTTEYVLDSPTTVRFNVAPADGVSIRIFRLTDTSDTFATFYAGSAIRSVDLNNNFEQGLFVAQEAQRDSSSAADAFIFAEQALSTATAADEKSDTAIADSSAALSLATTADTNATQAVALATEAEEDAENALIAAGTALTQVGEAQQSALDAEAAAEAAQVSAAQAETDATAAVATATTANNNANTAITTANSAVGTAGAAQTTANSAVSAAADAQTDADTAISTADNAVSVANAAQQAISEITLVEQVANVAALPSSPSDGDVVEVLDSTGIESVIAGEPSGFVGDPGLSVKISYTTQWTYVSYRPNDPDDRYANPTDIQNTLDAINAVDAKADQGISNAATAQSAANAAQSTADGAVSDASAAQSIASDAVSDASTAQSTANTARSEASTAQTAANNANDAALLALTAANERLPLAGGTMTGAITFASNQSIPVDGIAEATTSNIGVIQLYSGTDNSSNSLAATAGSVRTADQNALSANATAVGAKQTADSAAVNAANAASNAATALSTANAALPKAGGTLTGGITLPGNTSGNRISFSGGQASTGIRYNTNGNLQMRVNSTTGLEVDSAGKGNAPNGMSATNLKLTDGGTSGSPVVRFNDDDTGVYYADSVGSGALRLTKNGTIQWTISASALTFNTGDGDIESINDNDGFKFYGRGRNNSDVSYFSVDDNSSSVVVMKTRGRSSGNVNEFYADGSAANKQNDWGGTSDARLKENIIPAKDQWDDVKAFAFYNYNFIDSPDSPQFGVIAQELMATSPGLVTENAEGYLRVKTSVLTLKAVKALQEAMARIEELERRLDELSQ